MEEQVVALYAAVHGHLDDIPVSQVPRFQEELREFMRTEESVLKEIREKKELSDALEQRLEEQIEKFKQTFNVEKEESLV
jgi:F-type H+-transporting ATPase subunit alpha